EVQQQAFEQMKAFRGGKAPSGPRPAGHFAGLMVGGAGIDFADPDFRDAGLAASVFVVGQQALEAILGAWAAELGVDLRRGIELTTFDTDEAGVTVHLTAATTT